jgi:hypothetical protein
MDIPRIIAQSSKHCYRIPRGDKDRERIDSALKDLADFDRRLADHHLDKGALDSAIQDVAKVPDKISLNFVKVMRFAMMPTELRRVRDKYQDWH